MYSFVKDYEYDAEKLFGIIMKKLKDKGYITLSYIDLKQILENNFQEKFNTYYIMNVCKPQAAKELIAENESMGLFLPCKITIYKTEKGARVSLLRVSTLADQYLNIKSGAVKYENEMIEVLENLL